MQRYRRVQTGSRDLDQGLDSEHVGRYTFFKKRLEEMEYSRPAHSSAQVARRVVSSVDVWSGPSAPSFPTLRGSTYIEEQLLERDELDRTRIMY